jgi:hypothetical protein
LRKEALSQLKHKASGLISGTNIMDVGQILGIAQAC